MTRSTPRPPRPTDDRRRSEIVDARRRRVRRSSRRPAAAPPATAEAGRTAADRAHRRLRRLARRAAAERRRARAAGRPADRRIRRSRRRRPTARDRDRRRRPPRRGVCRGQPRQRRHRVDRLHRGRRRRRRADARVRPRPAARHRAAHARAAARGQARAGPQAAEVAGRARWSLVLLVGRRAGDVRVVVVRDPGRPGARSRATSTPIPTACRPSSTTSSAPRCWSPTRRRAERELEAIPWVDDAKVTAHFPHGATIEIRERAPVATYQGPDGQFRVLDRDGRVLDVLDRLPVRLRADHRSRSGRPRPVRRSPRRATRRPPSWPRTSPARCAARSTSIEVTADGSRLVMLLDDGTEVRFGEARDLFTKLVRLETRADDRTPTREPGTIDVSTSQTTL